jgi:hypothetical protein
MSRFEIGQRVECVDACMHFGVTHGSIYVVSGFTCLGNLLLEGVDEPASPSRFVAVTDAESVQPADECTCLDQPQWCASCLKRIEAWQGCPEPDWGER